jgi:hypothetical protein
MELGDRIRVLLRAYYNKVEYYLSFVYTQPTDANHRRPAGLA